MRLPFRLGIPVLALLLGASPAPASRVAEVEAGLRPAIVLADQPVPLATITDEMARLGVPGASVSVIHEGRIAWSKGYGVVAPGGPPVKADTPFQAGSISKAVTAVGALVLARSSGLPLDAAVEGHLRGWRPPANAFTGTRPITLRGLLSHTAGINVRTFPGYAAGERVPTLQQVLDGVPPANTDAVRVVAAPGTAWRYSGGGYAIVQRWMEDVSGAAFADWMHDRVLAPLGMQDSSFVQQTPAGAAMPHAVDGSPVAGGAHRYPAAAAAGLWSTATDLARLLLALQEAVSGDPGLLDPATTRAMLAEVQPGHAMGFELGGAPDARYFSKGGDTEGFAAYMVAYTDRGDGAVVMTNGARGRELAEALVRSIAAAYDWPGFQPRVRAAVALDASTEARLLGSYRYGPDRTFTVARDAAGQLTIASPGERPERLYAATPHRLFVLSQDIDFVFDPSDGSAARTGHIDVGNDALPFQRIDDHPP